MRARYRSSNRVAGWALSLAVGALSSFLWLSSCDAPFPQLPPGFDAGTNDAGSCTYPSCSCLSTCAACECEHPSDPSVCGSSCGGGPNGTGGSSGTGGYGTGGSYGSGGSSGSGGSGVGGGSSCPGAPAGSPCSLVAPQCGCGPGLGCQVHDDGSTYCTAAGSVPPYAPCSGGLCAAGSVCLNNSGTTLLCAPFCKTDSDCVGGACLALGTSQGTGNVPGIGYCASGCDLENPQAICGAGLSCETFLASSGASTTGCIPAGTKTGANGCSSSNPYGCAPGFACMNNGYCRRWCRVDLNDCPSGTNCTSFNPNIAVNGINYGFCQ